MTRSLPRARVASHPTATVDQIAKADKLDQEGREARQRSIDSFDRCDTDGFLSQWANDMTSSLNSRKAEILRAGGCAQFRVLVNRDGLVVADQEHEFPHAKFDWVTVSKWRLCDAEADKAGRRWIPTGEKSRVQKQLGLQEDMEWGPAYAKITTGSRKSTGLSGCANAYVGTFRQGEE